MAPILRILMLEDNPADAVLVQRELARAGVVHAAVVVDTPAAYAAELRNRPDIILSDYSMPAYDGLTALAVAREQAGDIPFVFVSGAIGEERAIEALKNGATDYVLKDRLSRLAPVVRRALREAEDRRERIRSDEAVREQAEILRRTNRDLEETNARLERLTLLDPLTELLNRRGLQRSLTKAIGMSQDGGAGLLALLIDLDDFKHVNDTLGYAVGDVVLKDVAAKLKAAVGNPEHVSRLGGDEFLVLLPGTPPQEGRQVAERIRLAISGNPLHLSSERLEITASLGLVEVPRDVASVDELLSLPCVSLSQSKRLGKNRVSVAAGSPARGRRIGDPLAPVLAALRSGEPLRAIRHPIVALPDERTVGYEMLSRSSLKDFESPHDFFHLAYEANILTLVDHQCFLKGLAATRALGGGARFHLNLFPSTLMSLPVQNLLAAFPDPTPGRYCIELSEQQILGDPSYLVPSLSALRRAGVLVAIDDVGFGRSCLENLVLLEPDIIKIDQRCVRGLSRDAVMARALQRLMTLITSLGMEAIAEGVETREDLAVLRELGVPCGQGYLWGEPA